MSNRREASNKYILRYQEREGIRLDVANIAKNPGRKATAKLMLNVVSTIRIICVVQEPSWQPKPIVTKMKE